MFTRSRSVELGSIEGPFLFALPFLFVSFFAFRWAFFVDFVGLLLLLLLFFHREGAENGDRNTSSLSAGRDG